jgi:hypothetical protein
LTKESRLQSTAVRFPASRPAYSFIAEVTAGNNSLPVHIDIRMVWLWKLRVVTLRYSCWHFVKLCGRSSFRGQSPWESSASEERTASIFRVIELVGADALEPIESPEKQGKTFLQSVGTFSHYPVHKIRPSFGQQPP